jgi:hypothetical protein
MKSLNNLKQLVLALHQNAGDDGFIGGYILPSPAPNQDYGWAYGPPARFGNPQYFTVILLDGPWSLDKPADTAPRPYLVSPADPSDFKIGLSETTLPDGTVRFGYDLSGPTSYAFNMAAFTGPPRFPLDFTDGTSNTIAFAERYYVRYFSPEPINEYGSYAISYMCYAYSGPAPWSLYAPYVLGTSGFRRPSFADAGWGDVVPVTSGEPPVTRPSVPGVTFQVRPALMDANAYQLQTPFSAGLPVALFDGSVRTVRPGVAPEVFWAAVTRDGGEVGGDW